MNKFVAPFFLLGLVVILGNCSTEQLTYSAIQKQIEKAGKVDFFAENKDGITVMTVGTASPLPGERAQTATAVLVNGHYFMFDLGAGAVQKSEIFNLPLNKLDGIFLTHYHSDHYMDLPNMISRSWQRGRKVDLHVYGPTGLNRLMAAVDDFLAIDNVHRVAHHGPDIMDISFAGGIAHEFVMEQNTYAVVYEKDGIKITAFDVSHEPIEPAVGYKIEYKGKSVVISGDTKKNELLVEMAMDCDLLVHEVMLMSFQQMLEKANKEAGLDRNAHIMHDIQNYHTSPGEVAEIAVKAKVKKLVLNHLAPVPGNGFVKRMYLKQLKTYDGEKHLAEDGDIYYVN